MVRAVSQRSCTARAAPATVSRLMDSPGGLVRARIADELVSVEMGVPSSNRVAAV